MEGTIFASFVSLPTEEFLKFSLVSSSPTGCSLSSATECGRAPRGDSEGRGEEGKLVLKWGLDLTFPKTKSSLSHECWQFWPWGEQLVIASYP